ARQRKALVENAVDVVCQLNADASIAAVNASSSALLGAVPDKLQGRRLTDLVFTDDRERVDVILAGNKRGESVPPADVRILQIGQTGQTGGKLVDALLSATWSEVDQSFFCVIHDNTVKKEGERLRQEVLQMVNHDLRSPLLTVTSFLEMTQEGMFVDLDERAKSRLSAAVSGTRQMQALIDDLLELEKINAGMCRLDLTKRTLSALIEESWQEVKEFADEKRLGLKSSHGPAEDVEPNVSVDVELMKRALATLFKTAISLS